jgi:hypothetical protein
MRRSQSMACVFALIVAFGARGRAASASDEEQIDLVVKAGSTLRVALDQRIKLRRVGQSVTGTLVEAIYSYDRSVVPAGTKVIGHIEKLEGVSKGTRVRAILRGDFTPLRRATLQFDTLVLSDGQEIPIKTQVNAGSENVSLEVAGASRRNGVVGRAQQEIAQRKEQLVAAFKQPRKMDRLKDMLVSRLPYHPQYLSSGTVYTAELLSPLDFGAVTPIERAAAGTLAPPESVLNARLTTPLDSAKTPRGTPIRAVLTQPLFSADRRLILPEGTELYGEVTFAKGARRFHRNGQLRFLFETVQLPEQNPERLLASLYSVELSQDDHVAVDEEGGTSVKNSKTRFIAPALALLAARASVDHERVDNDAIGGGAAGGTQGNVGSRGLGGYFGLGVLGAALSQTSRPLAGVLGVLGVAQTVYSAVLGRGREVVIPADTPIQLQLSPAATTQ